MADRIHQVQLTSVVPGLFWPDDEWTVPTLRECLGKTLSAIGFGEFSHHGEPDSGMDGELEFCFGSTHPLKLTTTHMYGVVALPHPIDPQVMEADRMEWRRRDFSVVEPWSTLVGTQLRSVDALIKPDIGFGFRAGVAGLLFRFSGGASVGYDNWEQESGRSSFNPSGGIWSEGRVLEWMACNAAP